MYAVQSLSATIRRFSHNDVRNSAAVSLSVDARFAAVRTLVANTCIPSCTPAVLTAVLRPFRQTFLENNPYAMCVNNHLEIDRTFLACTELSDKMLSAVSLCRQNKFYELCPLSQTVNPIRFWRFSISSCGTLHN